MTVVGKILVFLNLVFSLAVGWFAVANYTARTHWKDGFEKVKAQNDVLRSAADTYKKEADQLGKEREDLYNKFNMVRIKWDPSAKDDKEGGGARVATQALTVLADQAKSIEEMKSQVDDLRKQLSAEKAKNVTLLAMEKSYQADAERRQTDTKILRDTLKVEQDKNFKLHQEMNLMREDTVTAQIQARTLKDRNSQLVVQLQETARNLAQAKSSLSAGGVGAKGANPPSENLEGLVRKVDGTLVNLSLGSDAGLSKGQTMEVFRLGANSRYIGRVRIVEVTAKEAVGRIETKLTTPIQVGDRVASRILGSY